jgi:hypothetical protein
MKMAEAHLAAAAAGARTWTADVGAPALRSAIALAGEWASATRTAVAPHVRAAWSSSLRSVFAARAAADPYLETAWSQIEYIDTDRAREVVFGSLERMVEKGVELASFGGMEK